MKKINLNKKGFTLIELLAVIVVLAVVMLIAVTAVVPMMQRSQKQAFITEATTILEGAESYFIYKSMTGVDTTTGCVNINDSINAAGEPVSNPAKNDLLGEYVEEKGKTKYFGTVVKNGDVYTISLTDGKGKYVYATSDNISSLDDKAVKDSANGASTNYKASCS